MPNLGHVDKQADKPDCPETGMEISRMISNHKDAPLRRVSCRENIAQIHVGFFT
jgi:hypothetical protein